MNKQRGMIDPIVAILVLVVLVLGGLLVWQVTKSDKSTDSTDTTTTTATETEEESESDDEAEEETEEVACAPAAGEAKYQDTALGYCFVYPTSWGTASKTVVAGTNSKVVKLEFSKLNDYSFGQLTTKGYELNFMYSVHNDDYATIKKQYAAADSARKSGNSAYSLKMFSTDNNHFVVADGDCVDGGTYILGAAKINATNFDNVAIYHHEGVGTTNGCLVETGQSIDEVVNKKKLNETIKLLKSVEQL